MKQQHTDDQVASYPKIRRFTAAAYRSVQRKPMIHGLLEVDVTRARAILRAHKAQTGESLSFTAFLITCLAKAVDEQKAVQAIRQGSERLVIFDDVDVYTPIEHEVDGQKQVLPHIVRAANRKSFRAIHDEIRAAKAADVEQAVKGPRFLPAVLFGLYVWIFWRLGRVWPRLVKQNVGTVGITAVGMFGTGLGWGIPIPTPTPLMLTVGGISEEQILANNHTDVREHLRLTISADHDIVDGAPAARFAQRLKELIVNGYGLGDLVDEPEQVGADGAPQQKVEALHA
jgi:pyruvate/2-oxoglutarate dehydrogenase complex dihydrolipoamide acyltransferase (E2) component